MSVHFMTRPAFRIPGKVFAAALLLAAFAPAPLAAQREPYTMEALELWISGGVRVPRILRLVEGRCFDFELTPAVQDQLRRRGASEELIAGLVQRCPPPTLVAQRPPPKPGPVKIEPIVVTEARYSRRALYPLYFDRPSVMTFYGGAMTPQLTGMDPGSYEVVMPNGDTLGVQMPRVPETVATMGLSIGRATGVRFEGELTLLPESAAMLMVGPTLEPFIPLGRSGYRLILGATGWLSVVGQTLAIEDRETGLATSDSLLVSTFGAGGDARLGLAFHSSPGVWFFVEGRYRWIEPFYRTADFGDDVYVEEFSWPELSLRGPSLRIGIGL